MPDAHTPIGLEEYRALRATIRERGTARSVITIFIFVAWATLSCVVEAFSAPPAITLMPLVVLIAGFEIIFSLHVGVERIGRYLQVYFEEPPAAPPAWEHTVMRVGPPAGVPALALDPLLAGPFAVAALLNLVPAALHGLEEAPSFLGLPVELVVLSLLHLVFVLRIIQARRYASRLRASDLETFRRDRATQH
jgi:hypothetical protein